MVENWQVQGHSDPNRELLDAAALCRQLVPDGSVEAFLADHRQDLFPDAMFEDLFPSRRGRPSVPAEVVASVMVLQALEGLSDRDAARALRDRISWKVACGLALTDEGFDYSVLTYWRTRLRTSERPERIFDAVRSVIEATGVLKGRTRRALDSTLLDDAVATQDTVTQLISAIRRVRRVAPGAATSPSRLMTTSRLENHSSPGMTRSPRRPSSTDWSTMLSPSLAPSTMSPRIPRPPPPSVCWPSWPAKTSSRTVMEPGGSSSRWPKTALSQPSISRPVTCTSRALNTATATRPTSPSNPRPGWSLRPS